MVSVLYGLHSQAHANNCQVPLHTQRDTDCSYRWANMGTENYLWREGALPGRLLGVSDYALCVVPCVRAVRVSSRHGRASKKVHEESTLHAPTDVGTEERNLLRPVASTEKGDENLGPLRHPVILPLHVAS